ncbi:glycosyltransferase family 2 protein [Paenibacillus silvae]|uniref:glycosyltransferase family 2 protein n=1 Tax=Paenibacillus silvae TaxID=1325358 RepID=UPI0020053A20|nr:glycosyltransferase [Paenibacillus silvae]MCK6148715.1 glycosyltransferase [Paenibacillus silvae]MCK6267015.1 glycosyltransferase [Paenibacillus silvae]
MSQASVIMPTYNKAEYLKLTLASFASQSVQDFEIIIIDDGSTDDTKQVVDNYKNLLNIRYVFQQNKGRSRARNTGLQLAEGDIIIFNDDDRIVLPDYIASHIDQLTEQDERTVVIGWKKNMLSILKPRLPFSAEDMLVLVRQNPEFAAMATDVKPGVSVPLITEEHLNPYHSERVERYTTVDGYDSFPEIFAEYGEDLKDFQLKWVLGTTANMSLYRSFLQEIGSFDEQYKGWGMEDTDLSYRLYKAGGLFRFCSNLINLHQFHPRGNAFQAEKDFRRNSFYFCNKHKSLEAYLFYRWTHEEIELKTANNILQLANHDESVAEELTNLYAKGFASGREELSGNK